MRRRNHLQVNTFPFLAVLLCAMGSLILILLVMDRRARRAAVARGRDVAGKATRERDEAIAARERENSHKHGEVKTVYDRKKADLKARLDAEQSALDGEMRQVQARIAEVAAELRGEEDLVGKLRTKVRTEQTQLTRHEQALESARKEAAGLEGKRSSGDRARQKLAADLVQLEQIIRDLQETRKRDAMTYSVVPYKGKHGEKRRPLYVECNASGLVFHPDRLTLADPSISSIQQEIARRATNLAGQRKRAGLKEERAYLMMLIRPEGVKRYYQVQSAIHDLPVEFGYEFVDGDWALAVPEGAEPVETPSSPEEGKPSDEPVRVVRTGDPVAKVEEGGSAPGGLPGGPAIGIGPPSGGGPAVGIDPPSGSGPAVGFGPPVVTTAPDTGVRSPRPQTLGEGPDLGTVPGGGIVPKGAPSVGEALPLIGEIEPPREPPLVRLPAVLPGSTASGAGQGAPAVAGGPRKPNGQAFQGPDLGPAKPRPFPLLPARVGGAEETIVFVECLSDGVVVHPSGKSMSIDSLNHSPSHNALYQAVAAKLAKHKGDPKRRTVRFLIHRDGERTFHLAYPLFNGLDVTKTRYSLQSDDDVSRIVADE